MSGIEVIGVFLRSVPDVVWSGLLASLITLVGVFFSNCSNRSRLETQLRHDREEKEKERTATLRREISLEAVGEFTEIMYALSQISTRDMTDPELASPAKKFSSTASRLQLVVEPRTALKIQQFSFQCAKIYMQLIARATPISQARTNANISKHWFEISNSEVNRLLIEMKKLNESSQHDHKVFISLSNSYTIQQQQMEKHARDMNFYLSQVQYLTLQFNKELLERIIKIVPDQNAIFLELRRDLGLNAEIEMFKELTNQQTAEIIEEYHNVINALQKETNEQKKDNK